MGKVPSAGPAMKGKTGTAAGRSTHVEPSRLKYFLVVTGRPSLHLSVCWRKFQTVASF
jgi:hypothetical protein